VNRGLVGLRGAALILLIGAGLQLLSGSTASATVNGPGTMTVAPTAVVAGSTSNTFTFAYVPGSHRLIDGKVKVTIPAGWTDPQATVPSDPGFVTTNTGTLSVVDQHIVVNDLTMCKTCSLQVTYSDATAPTTPGPATFLAKAAATAAELPAEPLSQSPTVDLETGCASQAVTTVGPPSLTATYGTCLNGGSVTTLTGSGYDANSLGVAIECNDDPNQPTVSLPAPVEEIYPVSCSGIALQNAKSTTASGDLPGGATFTIISPIAGPPCGPQYLIATCPATDSSGGNPTTDAADYPCPPTAAQQSIGISCTLSFSDQGGKFQSVDISFVPDPS
jgi:hypothetical protein